MSDSGTFRVSPYAPANETSYQITVEALYWSGVNLGSVGYGVHATLYFWCLNLLWNQIPRQRTYALKFIAYITSNFILGTVGHSLNINGGQLAFVNNRDFPGGPIVFVVVSNQTNVKALVGYAAYVINTWLQDGLLVYRLLVVFGFNWWIAFTPGMIYLLSIISSMMFLHQIQHPLAFHADLGLVYWSASISLTIIITSLIIGWLFLMRLRLGKAGSSAGSSPYVSISAMLMESAALYTVIGIAFLIFFVRQSSVQFLLLPLFGQAQSIAPLLIILRVAQGRAWSRKTVIESTLAGTPNKGSGRSKTLTPIVFQSNPSTNHAMSMVRKDESIQEIGGDVQTDFLDVRRHSKV